MNWATIKHAVAHYLYACFAKSWNGALVAIYAMIGQAVGAGLDPGHFNIPDWRTFAYTFAVVFSVQALGFLKDNPLPDKLPDTNPPFATQAQVDAGRSKTTMVSPATLAKKT